MRPHGASSPEPVETELHLPDQLQAAVGALSFPGQIVNTQACMWACEGEVRGRAINCPKNPTNPANLA